MIKHPDPNAAEALDQYEVFKREHALADLELVPTTTEAADSNDIESTVVGPTPVIAPTTDLRETEQV